MSRSAMFLLVGLLSVPDITSFVILTPQPPGDFDFGGPQNGDQIGAPGYDQAMVTDSPFVYHGPGPMNPSNNLNSPPFGPPASSFQAQMNQPGVSQFGGNGLNNGMMGWPQGSFNQQNGQFLPGSFPVGPYMNQPIPAGLPPTIDPDLLDNEFRPRTSPENAQNLSPEIVSFGSVEPPFERTSNMTQNNDTLDESWPGLESEISANFSEPLDNLEDGEPGLPGNNTENETLESSTEASNLVDNSDLASGVADEATDRPSSDEVESFDNLVESEEESAATEKSMSGSDLSSKSVEDSAAERDVS